jgi:hypothetical protein
LPTFLNNHDMIPAEYPKARLLRADAVSVLATWLFLGLSGLLWLIALVWSFDVDSALKLAVWAFFLAAGGHVALAYSHQCPGCGKHPTVQGFAPPHPASLGQSRVQGWAGVVLSVLLEKRFVCIHCGTEFRA